MYALGAVRDTLVEVVQVIEKDEPDVQPGHAEEEGEEQQAEPDTVALKGAREKLSHPHFRLRAPNGWQIEGLPARHWAAL